jgi:hypothetical protein
MEGCVRNYRRMKVLPENWNDGSMEGHRREDDQVVFSGLN